MKGVMLRLEQELSNVDFDFDLVAYKKEINRLLRRCEELRQAEQRYKEKLIELDSERIRLVAQRDIVIQARKELDADYIFAHELSEDSVDCPLCGTNFSNDIGERFAIAQDEDRCVSLLQEIEVKLGEIEDKMAQHQLSLSESSSELKRVNSILAEKKGRVTLRTVIESQGKRELSYSLKADLESTQNAIGQLDAELREIQGRIRRIEDKRTRKQIVDNYHNLMRHFCNLLNVRELDESAFSHIDADIKESGSDLPRAILAYFLSIGHTIRQYGYYTRFPLVIDAPNQQEQDRQNFQRMLQVIRDERPEGSQLVMAVVDDMGIDFGGSVVELHETNYSLLLDEYEALADEIRPYINANLSTGNTG
jgi:hypothetical protein